MEIRGWCTEEGERRAPFGELAQMDGSHHRWLEERGEKCCLMNLVDDATGRTLSIFANEETTEAAMRLLKMWIEKYGVPTALYVDRKKVYVPDAKVEEEARQEGREHYTQCARIIEFVRIEQFDQRHPSLMFECLHV